MLRLLHRLTHPGEARRLYALDHAHRTSAGQRVPLAGEPVPPDSPSLRWPR